LGKIIRNNPTIVLASPSIKSSNSLPALNFISSPLKPQTYRQKKLAETTEAKASKMLRMKSTDLQNLYTDAQKPKSLIKLNLQKSESLIQVPYWKEKPSLCTDMESMYKMRRK